MVLLFVAVLLLLPVSQAKAMLDTPSDQNEEFDPNTLVEVRIIPNPNSTYAERRSNWSWRFSIAGEAFAPTSYVSLADGSSYNSLFGIDQAALATVSVGVQYNTRLGAIYLDGQYGGGSVGSKVTGSSLRMSKYGGTMGIMLDTLSNNPWVSPFVAFQAVYFGYTETATNIFSNGTTEISTGYMVGLSLHLNRIDRDTAKDGYMDYRLRNSFLDIYGVQYNTSNSAADPDFQTNMNIGAGFHIEF